MLGIMELFQKLPERYQPVRCGNIECSLSHVGSGLQVQGNSSGIDLTECDCRHRVRFNRVEMVEYTKQTLEPSFCVRVVSLP